jgi:hypothetical protein
MKSPRYLYFVMPFFFAIIGIAMAAIALPLRDAILEMIDRVLPPWLAASSVKRVRAALLVAGVLFLVGTNGAIVKSALIPLGIRLRAGDDGPALTELETRAGWEVAQRSLQPAVDKASIVLTSRDLQSLYYFGRYDILISESHLSEVGGAEFAVDDRTGHMVVGAPKSLNLIFDCYPDGIVIADLGGWRIPTVINDPAADTIEARTRPVALNESSDILAFTWDHQGPPPRSGADCDALMEAVKR